MEYVVKMIDGGIREIVSDDWKRRGCETCDYGSAYVNDYEIFMDSGTLSISVEKEYEYALSEGDMMKLFLNNVETIEEMREEVFPRWIEAKLDEFTKEVKGMADDLDIEVDWI